jgi:rare lipoprotein A
LKRASLLMALSMLMGACGSEHIIREPAPPPIQMPVPVPLPLPPPPAPPPAAVLNAIADAVPRIEPRSALGNPVSYEVFGKRYFLLPSAEGFRERGVASWYGPNFHSRPTSSGEPYDMYAMTAAHKTLPIPAYVRVTNLGNGRSIVVRVNDRGPFVGNRIIDLSYTAAYKLDMWRAGTAFVDIEVLTPNALPDLARSVTATQTVPTLATPVLYLQIGAFSVADNANALAEKLRRDGFPAIVLPPGSSSPLYRVRVGPVSDVASFDQTAARLTALGHNSLLVTE